MTCFNGTVKCFPDQEESNQCSSSDTACFDCSICSDFAVDPVVTLCGHLYCWPCIYRWLQQANTTSPRQCPVCRAPLSENAVIPLYGFGRSSLTTDPDGSHKKFNIPIRPRVMKNNGEYIDLQYPPPMRRQQLGHQHHYNNYSTGGIAVSLVLPLLSRNYCLRRLYGLEANGSSGRARRQELRVEESLRQLWTFLLCGAVLCLLSF